jgi:DNA polymerase
MFIGEAPGHDEDIQGVPFVGRAGQLLTKIISAMGYDRKDVYITNVVKCRPPQNRNPMPSEIFACRGYLKRQIEIIEPKVICMLGKFAASVMIGSDLPISQIRGKFFDFYGIKLMPTFHPAYLLRNPADKKLVWHDMKKILSYLNNEEEK